MKQLLRRQTTKTEWIIFVIEALNYFEFSIISNLPICQIRKLWNLADFYHHFLFKKMILPAVMIKTVLLQITFSMADKCKLSIQLR